MQITAKHRHERTGDIMTMKTKRSLAIGSGTVLCAVLAILIAARFAPEPEATAPDTSNTSSAPAISVQISTAKREETKPIEIEKPTESIIVPDNSAPAESDPEQEAADFIEDGGIEIEQPEPPKIEDEEMLTNPDKEPTYEPEQTEIKPQTETPSDTPKHGDKKDGQIYINGFGWIKDEGGGGIGYTDTEMYQNGNAYFCGGAYEKIYTSVCRCYGGIFLFANHSVCRQRRRSQYRQRRWRLKGRQLGKLLEPRQ